jgi:AcrR family transcriptional regulator
MPRTKEQYEKIRLTRQMEIIRSGLELFALQGYEGTTIEQIAVKAEISKGLFYSYFKSKEHLLKEIFSGVAAEMLHQADIRHDGELSDDEMSVFVDRFFAQVKKNPAFWRFYTAVSLQPSVSLLLQEELLKLSEPLLQLFNGYFARKGYADPYAEMAVFGAMLSGAVIKYVTAPEYFPLDSVRDRILEMYK